MEFQKASPGDPLSIPAGTYNAFVDAAVAYRQSGAGKPSAPNAAPSRFIKIRNTGSDVAAFRAVGMNAPTFLPASVLASFQAGICLDVDVPASGQKGLWCVTQGPIKSGAIGSAIAIGITQCWINVVAATDTFVEIAASNVVPQSGKAGSAQIVWVAGGVGSASATGTQWALIKIGGGQSIANLTFAVGLTQTGGSAGDQSTPVSFTYTVKDLAGNTLGTGVAPKWPSRSENGLKVAATEGQAYYDNSGALKLPIAFESAGTGGCS